MIARAALLVVVLFSAVRPSALAIPAWTSPDHYRVLLTVTPGAPTRTNSPAKVDIYFQTVLNSQGSTGIFDENTIEVVAYNASGQPKVYDAARAGYEQYLLPWRVERFYGTNQVTLSFVMPDKTYTQYAVYFDTVESGLGKPDRYPGIVGDGDRFTEGYKRRVASANHMDDFADFDGDGDLDLFKSGIEPFIECHENVGANKFVYRGRMTSGGSLFTLPAYSTNRSWSALALYDWDGDSDQDLFVAFADGPDMGQIVRYENITTPGGQITFRRVTSNSGYLVSLTGKALGDYWWATPLFVDWDGDGKTDVLTSKEGFVVFYRNVGTTSSVSNMQLNDGVYIRANGAEIRMLEPRLDCADIDNDGDLDLFAANAFGCIYLFKNVGTRTTPAFSAGRTIAFYEAGAARSGIKVVDWDGDGLLDFIVGRYWENTHWGEEPREYGHLFKNVGTLTSPRFEARDAYHGAPYTERFQIADAVRQNGVRVVDWNSDGKMDLIASDTDGFVWLFRNLAPNPQFPVFAAGERLQADGRTLKVASGGEYYHGYARCDVCDWDNDGKLDVLVADTRGWLTRFPGTGSPSNPTLGAGVRVMANGKPIDGTHRASVLVCDWDNDGKKDVILGMGGNGDPSDYYDWTHLNSDPSDDAGFLFYKNTGTDAAPVLAFPTWIREDDGGLINYNSRPNLGSYVDWDGDGKKDFITGEFENSIRFYKNIGPGGANQQPVFADINGVTIVQPSTVMLVSGAHAVDWNLDGDIDILTGQGHAGSGLRFYERNYINDFVNNTFPTVSVGSNDHGFEIAAAKLRQDGQTVTVPQGIVSAAFSGFFYIESLDRTSGIRVQKSNHGVLVGQRVDVTGTLATNSDGERYISATTITQNGF